MTLEIVSFSNIVYVCQINVLRLLQHFLQHFMYSARPLYLAPCPSFRKLPAQNTTLPDLTVLELGLKQGGHCNLKSNPWPDDRTQRVVYVL
jgi:hypothetical protein